MISVQIPSLPDNQGASWFELAKLSKAFPNNWTLIGGQLIQIHCWERNVEPTRVTTDIDAVLNVIAFPEILKKVTTYLIKSGFNSAGTTNDGHQYKWKKSSAEIDLLIPDHVGNRARNRVGITGSTTIETPGGRIVFDFNEQIEIILLGERYVINRPNIWGAMFIKSKALQNANDIGKDRHIEDLAVICTLLNAQDAETYNPEILNSILGSTIYKLRNSPEITDNIPGSDEGISRLELIIKPTVK